MTLKQFSKRVKNLNNKEMQEISEKILREMTLRFLKEVIQLTPVGKSRYSKRRGNIYIGGTLRRGWIVSNRYRRTKNKAKPTDKEIESFVNTLKFKKRGKTYYIKITNPVEYAKFVNYGHRKRGGKGWVEGYHFLEKAENYINRNQNKIFKVLLEKELKRRLGL